MPVVVSTRCTVTLPCAVFPERVRFPVSVIPSVEDVPVSGLMAKPEAASGGAKNVKYPNKSEPKPSRERPIPRKRGKGTPRA